MTEQECAKLMLEYSQFWPIKTTDMRLKIRAYWKAMEDLGYLEVQRGLLDLSRSSVFAPTVAELRQAAEFYHRRRFASPGTEFDFIKLSLKRRPRLVRREFSPDPVGQPRLTCGNNQNSPGGILYRRPK